MGLTDRMHRRSWLAAHPGKRATERFWLLYTPVWGAVAGIVMITGWAERWEDFELMLFGVGLAVPALVGPLLLRPESKRHLPLYQTAAFKLCLSVVGLSFGLNYLQTPYFWDVLHMHYGFNATITIDNNPVFLYFLTIAYFSTYCALCTWTHRWFRSRFPSRAGGAASWIVAPLAMALLETALNANPFMDSLFCYDDMELVLWFGTLSYSVSFVLALPMWMHIDEEVPGAVPWWRVVIWVGAVLCADLIVLDVLRHHVAPYVTTVVEGANGLRDFDTSCLVPPVL